MSGSNPNPYEPTAVPSMTGAPRGEFASCPNCRGPNAKRVSWTLWGGALGPRMFTHVKCQNCGTCFNGKTGHYNTTGIVIYLVVSLVIGLAIGAVLLLMQIG